jgi:hypothetical protein
MNMWVLASYTDVAGETQYWNDEKSWGSLKDATVFSHGQKPNSPIPQSKYWVRWVELPTMIDQRRGE